MAVFLLQTWEKWQFYNTNLDLVHDYVYTKFG